jgi:hypothetical protein
MLSTTAVTMKEKAWADQKAAVAGAVRVARWWPILLQVRIWEGPGRGRLGLLELGRVKCAISPMRRAEP